MLLDDSILRQVKINRGKSLASFSAANTDYIIIEYYFMSHRKIKKVIARQF